MAKQAKREAARRGIEGHDNQQQREGAENNQKTMAGVLYLLSEILRLEDAGKVQDELAEWLKRLEAKNAEDS